MKSVLNVRVVIAALWSLSALGCVVSPDGATDVPLGAAREALDPYEAPSPGTSPSCSYTTNLVPGSCPGTCVSTTTTYSQPTSASTACRALTATQVAAGESQLVSAYGAIYTQLECEGVVHRGTGSQPSCVNVSNAVFTQIVQSIPAGWGCARRQHAIPGVTNGRDHWVVECYTLPLATPQRHIVFDYWADSAGPTVRSPIDITNEYGPVTAQQATWRNCDRTAGQPVQLDMSALYPRAPYVGGLSPSQLVLANRATPGTTRVVVSQVDRYGIQFNTGAPFAGANVELERISGARGPAGVIGQSALVRVGGTYDASGRELVTWNVTPTLATTPGVYNVYFPT